MSLAQEERCLFPHEVDMLSAKMDLLMKKVEEGSKKEQEVIQPYGTATTTTTTTTTTMGTGPNINNKDETHAPSTKIKVTITIIISITLMVTNLR